MQKNGKDGNKRIVVLISGNGSNLQALIDQVHLTEKAINIVAVISNNADAYGLQRAKNANIDALAIDHRHYDNRTLFDQALSEKITHYQPDLIVLAGFMRILTSPFVRQYSGLMLNIHPSLLPDFPGLNTHQRVLDKQHKLHGASVHFVTEQLDGGPCALQAAIPVLTGDTAEILAERIHVQEHLIYPEVVRWFCNDRLRLKNGQAILDNKVLPLGGIRINSL